jgi:hypothetical protein
MNDIFIIILTAIIGVVGTILTQTITRRMRLPELKRKQNLKNLQNVKLWIEAYRALFKCQYPMAIVNDIFVLLNNKSSEDKITSKRVYSALKQFQDLNAKCDEAKRVGQPSLISFSKPASWLDRVQNFFWNTLYKLFGVRWLYRVVSRITDNNDVLDLANEISELGENVVTAFNSIIVRSPKHDYIPSEYGKGLPTQVYPYLKTIDEQRYKLFDNFPDFFFRVEWEKLDFIEPENVILIIHKHSLGEKWPGRLEERYEWKSWGITIKDDLENVERTARYAIDDILNIIREYESKLLLEVEISNEK